MTKTYAMAREVPNFVRHYLTPGRPYLVERETDIGFWFHDDNRSKRFADWQWSPHLDGADWTRLTEAEALEIMIEQDAGKPPTVAVPADLWGDIMTRLQIIASISLHARENAVKASIDALLTRIKEAGL